MFICFGAEFEEKNDRTSATQVIMIMDRFAKWLFPRWQPFRRKREIRSLIAALWVGLAVAGLITTLMILINSAAR